MHQSFSPCSWTRIPPRFPALDVPDVTISAILEAINSIRSRAVGPDQLSIAQLKGIPSLLTRLQCLYKASLQSGVVSDLMKEVRITPVPKKAVPLSIADFRPIAVACCVMKILEKLVAKHITSHAEDLHLFDDHQFGSRAGLNTDSAILHLLEHVRQGFDANFITLALFIDLRRASHFECVPHCCILSELRRIGASEGLIAWFQSFLGDRAFTVVGRNGLSGRR